MNNKTCGECTQFRDGHAYCLIGDIGNKRYACSEACENFVPRKQQTNGDLARSMDDRELAEFIFDILQMIPKEHMHNKEMIGAIAKMLSQPIGFDFLAEGHK